MSAPILSRSDLRAAYELHCDYCDMDRSVGALAVQVEGQLAVVGGLTGSVHDPKTASEHRPNAEIIEADPEWIIRKSERQPRV